MGKLFGTDGIRGLVGEKLTVDLALDVAKAAACVIKEKTGKERPLFLLGKDTRISGDALEAAMVAGLCATGVDVLLLGVVPSPAVAYLVPHYKADAGIMLSASHNPYMDNGIKIFGPTGYKLTDSQEQEIEALVLDKAAPYAFSTAGAMGRVNRAENAARDYIDHLLSTVEGDFSHIKAVVDCSNGSASTTAGLLFAGLGVDYTLICSEPDGSNINENCGSTHTDALVAAVKAGDYDLGVAFDGDADRCFVVDEHGNVLDGDKILAILACQMRKQGTLKEDCVVVTVMSNLGFFKFAEAEGFATQVTKVGDRYVLGNMLEHGYNLGGEQSGHIILLDHMPTGDGQLTATQVIATMAATGRPLSELASVMEKYPQTLVNVRVSPDGMKRFATCEPVGAIVEQGKQQLGDRGRVLVRTSGTEPLVRVMVEGENEEEIQVVANAIADVIKENLAQ